MSNNEEIWVPMTAYDRVPDFTGTYEVSSHGNIRSVERTNITTNKYGTTYERYYSGMVLKPWATMHGYLAVLAQNQEYPRCTVFLHRAVANLFIPNPNNYPQVNHIDGNRTNNHVDNLEWCTAKQNLQHASETGLLKNRDNRQKLTFEDAERIRYLYENYGYGQFDLADMYGITQSHVANIIAYRTWMKPSLIKRRKPKK